MEALFLGVGVVLGALLFSGFLMLGIVFTQTNTGPSESNTFAAWLAKFSRSSNW